MATCSDVLAKNHQHHDHKSTEVIYNRNNDHITSNFPLKKSATTINSNFISRGMFDSEKSVYSIRNKTPYHYKFIKDPDKRFEKSTMRYDNSSRGYLREDDSNNGNENLNVDLSDNKRDDSIAKRQYKRDEILGLMMKYSTILDDNSNHISQDNSVHSNRNSSLFRKKFSKFRINKLLVSCEIIQFHG